MKFSDVLRGYVFPDEKRIQVTWAEADFCLDTNVLLDVYRYSDVNRANFLKLLSALRGRLFVPNRVAVEFARNRIGVIRGHFGPQRIIKSKLDESEKEIRAKHAKHRHLDELLALIASARKLVNDKYGEAEEKHLSLIADDTILRELQSVIGEDVGEPYPEADAQKEYNRRKEGMIPPFCKMDDDKDEERRTGDVVIWLELLKQYEGKKKPLIFVTDDMKENWWYDSGGGRHDPQPALVQEAYRQTGADVLFYTSERFSETAAERLGVEIPKALAEETKQIREQERQRLAEETSSFPFGGQSGMVNLGGTDPASGMTWIPSYAEQMWRASMEQSRIQSGTVWEDAAYIEVLKALEHQRRAAAALVPNTPTSPTPSPPSASSSAPSSSPASSPSEPSLLSPSSPPPPQQSPSPSVSPTKQEEENDRR
jgi:hypothetical protein